MLTLRRCCHSRHRLGIQRTRRSGVNPQFREPANPWLCLSSVDRVATKNPSLLLRPGAAFPEQTAFEGCERTLPIT